ncbi:putative metalloprotease CJM1_0395 family protein [Marinobacterium litorale]|uniref:putative metalloprotease CJM1_0395 family protein n=1 Tax=Marinobacterium litorale TaxID=404770 RepID=UPI00068629F4|nr:putative metalloprotease CJM1_0395 family protein [Marinobacterium litorale]
MITAISSTYSAYTSLPGTSAAPASPDEQNPSRGGADSTASQAATASRPTQSTGTGLRADQQVGEGRRASDVEQKAREQQNQQLVDRLESRDREVRDHERAHQAAGGGLTGAARFTYQRGPDGQLYAVGGEVSIDAPVSTGDPERDLERAQTVARAALAPAEPSAQDLRVAADAQAVVAQAQAELSTQQTAEAADTSGDESDRNDSSQAQPQLQADSRASDTVSPAVNEQNSQQAGDVEQDTGIQSASTGEEEQSAGPSLTERLDEQERQQAEREARQEELDRQREERVQSMAEYQEKMNQVQERLSEINQKLVEIGVLDPEFYVGSFVNDQA